MAELIERDLTIHSLSQHLSQGLYKGTDYMNDEIKWCCRVDISPVEAYARGFEYGIRLAQTIVSNRPTTTEAEIRASAIDEFAEKLGHKILFELDDCAEELDWIEEIAWQLKAGE